MTNHASEYLNQILLEISTVRKDKGYSLENMASELSISTSAYEKIEKQKTKLTVERLLQIREILDIPLHELLGIEVKNTCQQINNGESSGMFINEQNVQNLYQENQQTKGQLISSLEKHIDSLKEEIIYLRDKKKP